ncbi:protein Niban 1-like isoform X2 [Hippoglossus hippoglossus]|uniref:protein Niban 1-like isoform X2 n=1 Tax=Hippoglossus hippoglossus TaxID=8267 RepID=UPI00148B491C|nr:protein Niban 1-like isoform X2 [Hippoglossus hippoglossus]
MSPAADSEQHCERKVVPGNDQADQRVQAAATRDFPQNKAEKLQSTGCGPACYTVNGSKKQRTMERTRLQTTETFHSKGNQGIMGASSSGLLDEAKISHIKGIIDSTFQDFSVFYRQQYSAAYVGHLHQEVEPKKEGRGLLLTQRPEYAPEEVLYQGNVKFSCWDEQGKKFRERYAVLRRDYKVEIHENKESFNRGCAAKLVLQPTGGSVLTSEQESRAHLEKMCDGILNVKEDSSPVVSSPDVIAVYLHLPYTGHACFLFQQEEERDHFLSALKTCIRHRNLDPWCESSYESQAYMRALRLYRQDKGCYESWDMLLGTEEEVLASQVMEEVLPWLQSQLQSKVKGKKTERIRQWLATVHVTYTLALEQLISSMEVLREECRQTASANQALIRSNLDQIMSSLSFLEQKVRVCIREEAEKVYSESVAPYMSSILEVLTENISAGIHGMQHTLHTQMDSAFTHTKGGTEDTKKALFSLRSISLDQCYRQVKNLTETLADLKLRFGLSSTQRLVHSAHLEMEQLLDSAVYTLELFLQSSARLQPSEIPVKLERAKERVLKQLDYDSRVVQRRLYQEALLEITLPALTRRMDIKWKTELQQFEQYIFSDYSSFILIHNVHEDVLRNILSTEIETVVRDAASKNSNNLLLDMSDLAISEYSLLGQTPACSALDSPANYAQDVSSPGPSADTESAPVVEEEAQTTAQTDPELNAAAESDPSSTQGSDQRTLPLSPVIVVKQQFNESSTEEVSRSEEIHQDPQPGTDTQSMTDSTTADTGTPDHSIIPEPSNPTPVSPESSVSLLQSTDVLAECAQSDQSATLESSASSDQTPEDASVIQPCCPSPPKPFSTDSPTIISLESLNEAVSCNTNEPSVTMVPQTTDRAVYLTGDIKDSWEVERVKEEKQNEAEEEEKTEGDEDKGSELEKIDEGEADEREEHTGKTVQEEEVEQEQLQNPQPMEMQPESSAESPLDSVAIIRELVTEITEVETVVSPCPNNNAPLQSPDLDKCGP